MKWALVFVAGIATVSPLSQSITLAAEPKAGTEAGATNAAPPKGANPTPPGVAAKPKAVSYGCTAKQLQSKDPVIGPQIDDCLKKMENDVYNNRPHLHHVECRSGGRMYCCVANQNGGKDCEAIEKKKKPDVATPPKEGMMAQ